MAEDNTFPVNQNLIKLIKARQYIDEMTKGDKLNEELETLIINAKVRVSGIDLPKNVITKHLVDKKDFWTIWIISGEPISEAINEIEVPIDADGKMVSDPQKQKPASKVKIINIANLIYFNNCVYLLEENFKADENQKSSSK